MNVLSRKAFTLVSLSALFAFAVSADPSASLNFPKIDVAPGSTNSGDVLYTSQGESISALQFDVHYANAHLNIIPTIGPAGVAAGKILAYNVLPDGTLRVIVYGINQNVISDGDIVNLNVQADNQRGHYKLVVDNVVGSTPEGQTTPLTAKHGSVMVK